MHKAIFRTRDSKEIEVTGAPGDSLMEMAVRTGLPAIEGECGGQAMCATCHVYVDAAWADRLPAKTETEEALLDCVEAELRPTSRLCCQILLSEATDGIVVELPDTT